MKVVRKIATNVIYWPGFPLVRNGYIEIFEDGTLNVVDTGGELKEIPALEFFAGMIVPDFVYYKCSSFAVGNSLVDLLDPLYSEVKAEMMRPAIIEGADLRQLVWTDNAIVRML